MFFFFQREFLDFCVIIKIGEDMKKLESFTKYQEQIAHQEYLINLLDWDLRVHSPKDGKDYLIQVKSQLELNTFQLKTSEEYENILRNLIHSQDFDKLSQKEKRYITKLLEDYKRNKQVPEDFYQAYKKQQTITNVVWEEAKEKKDYSLFQPDLEKMIAMTKEYYQYLYPNQNLYDAMLDSYEKGMTQEVIDPLFQALKQALIPLVHEVCLKKETLPCYRQSYSDSELIDCAKYLLNYIGFDLKRGGLGIYPHGFTTKIHKDDIRIAFSNKENPFAFVSTIIHEGGHGIFEQNIDEKISRLNNDCADNIYGLHESQSRFFENILGRNIHFWKPIYADIKDLLHLDLSLEEFVAYLNDVKLGTIRTEADELTYCLHIIIRYEIERDLFSDKIEVADLPKIWNQKVKEYLGIEVPNDAEGVLQDVHWSEGSFGYFPSYLLGNIYDGMFLEAIEENIGKIDTLLENQQLVKIVEYLTQNIYQYGNTRSASEIIESICHKEISVEPIIRYFKEKYEK